MKQIGFRKTKDLASNDNLSFSVSIDQQRINIVFSEEHDGDIGCYLNVSDCEELVHWLQEAIKEISTQVKF